FGTAVSSAPFGDAVTARVLASAVHPSLRRAARGRAKGSSLRVTRALSSISSSDRNRLRPRPSMNALPKTSAPKLASWLQDNKFAHMPNLTRHAAGLFARARENVAALGSLDCGPRILSHDEPPERPPIKREFGRRNPYRYSGHVVKRIGRQASACIKLRAQRALWARLCRIHLLEEDVGLVFLQQRRPIGMRAEARNHPFEICILGCEMSTLDETPGDRRVGVAV